MALDDDIHKQVEVLSAKAEGLLQDGNFDEAEALFGDALALIPEPAEDYEAATWLYSAIGDTRFLAGSFKGAYDAFRLAVESMNGFGNPFIHERLGQCLFELGKREAAADELARAFLLADEEVFEGDDPKYLQFVKSKLLPEAKN